MTESVMSINKGKAGDILLKCKFWNIWLSWEENLELQKKIASSTERIIEEFIIEKRYISDGK